MAENVLGLGERAKYFLLKVCVGLKLEPEFFWCYRICIG